MVSSLLLIVVAVMLVATTLPMALLPATMFVTLAPGIAVAEGLEAQDDDVDDDDVEAEDDEAEEEDAETLAKSIALVGRIKKVAPEEQITGEKKDPKDRPGAPLFTLSSRGKTVAVDTRKCQQFYKHVPMQVDDVLPGTQVYVLARKQDSFMNPETQRRFPAQIVSIVTMLVAPGIAWSPPPLTQKQLGQKVQWISGTLQRSKRALLLNGTNMQMGLERLVVKLEKASYNEFTKRKPVKVLGVPDDPKRPTVLTARRIILLSKKIPKKEYAPLVGQ